MDKNKRSNISVIPSEKLIKVDDVPQDSREAKGSKTSSHANVQPLIEGVQLVEDVFGLYYDENGERHNIKRFTWKNKNKIQVQVITYGARITSMKVPDRKGNSDDIVLGFDDLAGYLFYKKTHIGGTIGRMTNIVKNGTFHINNKQFWLTPNQEPHHFNGGKTCLDQVIWTPYIDDKKLILSYVSPELSEGYPGALLLRVSFELSARNEFHIRMDAQCTQPTIVNLSNLTYFNLAGHHAGADHIYKHILTLNCNCFTPMKDCLPTGEILNVVHTEFDFQVPKVLGKVMGIVAKDGYNQNLCVSRGTHQDDCFVARVLHPPSGRMLEIYSNQAGVIFNTANEFGYGRIMSMEQLLPKPPEADDPLLLLFQKVHVQLMETLSTDEEHNYKEIGDLILKIKNKSNNEAKTPNNTPATPEPPLELQSLSLIEFIFTPMQIDYLNKILSLVGEDEEYEELKEVLTKILCSAIVREETVDAVVEPLDEKKSQIKEDTISEEIVSRSRKGSLNSSSTGKSSSDGKSKAKPDLNAIPSYYKSSQQIIGKERALYKMHGAIALQTQNYPACANFKNFPNCVLRPGETYIHTITYKFWVRAGNPNMWIKRNLNESKQKGLPT